MAETSRRRASPWVAFTAGAVAMLALVLAWTAWHRGREAVGRLDVTVSPDLSRLNPPRIPDAPKIPDLPVPKPR
jgi:hypothetical protein